MPLGFAGIAFTPSVRAEQVRLGSAPLHDSALLPERDGGRLLTAREVAFLEARDGMFQATLCQKPPQSAVRCGRSCRARGCCT